MDEQSLQPRVLREFGIRIGLETAQYLGRRILAGDQQVPVMGGEGRTGAPVAMVLDAARLGEGAQWGAS